MNKKGGIKIWLVFAYAIAIFIISAIVLAGSAMGDISRNGLVAEWHFDGDAKDSSGNGIDGVVNANKFADGKLGKALSLNGGSDFVDFGEGKGKLDFGKGPFSMEFWMNYQGRTVHPYVTDIMGKTSGQADSPGYFAWTTTWGGDGSNYGVFVATSTASWGNGNAEHWGAYLPNNWYHIVLVRDGTAWKIYKDGVFVYSQTKDGIGLNVDNDATFKMGESTREPNFQGLLDEVRVYNRALSADEIKTNFKAGQITITSTPSGAEIFVDGSSKGIASPSLSMNGISAGTYSVTCKLPGYTDYETNVVLSASSAASVECKLKLVPAPKLSVSPDPLTFNLGTMKAGESSSRIFSISNAGNGILTWSISDDQPWVNINPTSGTNSGTVTININTADLNPGSSGGNFVVTSNGGTRKGSISLNIPPTPTPTATTESTATQKPSDRTVIPPTQKPAETPTTNNANEVPWYSIIIFFLILAILASIYLIRRKKNAELDEDLSKIEEWKKEGYDVSELDRSLKGNK